MVRDRVFAALSLALAGLLLVSGVAHAQTGGEDDRLVVTWRPQVYVPAGFTGRALPTSGSRVTASIAFVDGGRLADLSGQTIYWYLNDAFIDSGRNQQTATFRLPERTGTTADLRVELPDYRGGVLKTVTIPIILPRVVIDAPFPSGVFSSAATTLRALPYFFNVNDSSQLVFSWDANGKNPGAENPERVTLDLGGAPSPGTRVSASVSVKNPAAKYFEAAADQVSLIFNQ